ncbi:hypothetical protein ACWC09_28790 [Streptomyces sp. NPDC001617]
MLPDAIKSDTSAGKIAGAPSQMYAGRRDSGHDPSMLHRTGSMKASTEETGQQDPRHGSRRPRMAGRPDGGGMFPPIEPGTRPADERVQITAGQVLHVRTPTFPGRYEQFGARR